MHRWPYCTGGHIAQVAVLDMWPYCTGGRTARVAVLHKWPYCTSDRIAQGARLHRTYGTCTSPVHASIPRGSVVTSRVHNSRIIRSDLLQIVAPTSGRIAQGAVLHKWPYCTSGRIARGARLHRTYADRRTHSTGYYLIFVSYGLATFGPEWFAFLRDGPTGRMD